MRNPKRIKPISKKLEKAWSLVPDWRLGQLISNLVGGSDPFHYEDDIWERLLDKFIIEYDKKTKEKNPKRLR